ncbi:MAG: hypothetical protein GY803_27085 [Chloroflexi bacterium]|nr:hypothetical protein [Chloroflexota bacterium]
MSLLQQAIQLLSETPGNVIYFLITLFALQAVFAIAYGQWRRDRADHLAARMAWAAGAIFLTRLGLALVGAVWQTEPLTAVPALAPLEQAAHTITAVFIVWAFVPHSTRYPRLGYVLLALSLAAIGVMTLSFVQTWQGTAVAGEAYNGSRQATVWGIIQLAVLGLGLIYLLSRRHLRFSLRAIIISLMALAHIAHFADYPEFIATQTNIAYWIRLGHLIAFPLWAAWAYRYAIGPLLAARQAQKPVAVHVAQSLDMAANVICSLDPNATIIPAIEMTAKLTGATFVGLALLDERETGQLYLASNQPQPGRSATKDEPRGWYLNLVDWPAFRQSLEQRQPVTLLPEGMGARQLRDWYQEMGIAPLGALFIQPMAYRNETVGLLLLAGLSEQNGWEEDKQILIRSLGAYLARVIDNGRYLARAAQQSTTTMLPEPGPIVSGRIVALEEERGQLKSELETAIGRLQQAEARAMTANKQARDLAATLNEMEQVSRDDEIEALQDEIEALRESLIEAEEAMALAAASEGELSTEWVMHTITRYSGELEAAQEQLQILEAELARRDQGPVSELATSLAQELRAPMTSIVGYTDILLAERIGILGVKQRGFVQRVQANTARMGALLDQLVQLMTETESPSPRPNESLADVEAAVETAVSAILTQIREKSLRLEMNIAPDLPLLPVNQDALRQIMTSLLGNACQASNDEGFVTVTAQTNSVTERPSANNNNQEKLFEFIHLAVTDSGGGISVEDRARVFDPQHNADSPLIAGLGDTGAAMSMARALAEANGGRIWVDSIMGMGSSFSALFPLAVAKFTTAEPASNGETAVPSTDADNA